MLVGGDDAAEEELAPFFRIVSDDEDTMDSDNKDEVKPQTIQFLNPDKPIGEDEYAAWREHLHSLFNVEKKPKHPKKQHVKKGQGEQEEQNEEPELTLEEQAEKILLQQLG